MERLKEGTSSKSLLGLIAAFATAMLLAFALGAPAKAMAANTVVEGVDAPQHVYLTKVVQASSGQVAPGGTFNFNFTAYSVDGDTAAASTAPAIAQQSIAVDTSKGLNVAVGTLEGSTFLPKATDFPHAGEYVYKVTEDTSNAIAGIKYDNHEYWVHVYIQNTDTGLAYGAITITKTDGTAGTPGGEKIDPTPGTNGDTTVKQSFPNASQFEFDNSTDTVGELSITKLIAGTYANKSQTFDVTVTLTLPTGSTLAHATGKVGDQTVNFDFTNGTASATVQMTNNSKLVIDNALPAGTTYQVSEPATQNFYATGIIGKDSTHDGTADAANQAVSDVNKAFTSTATQVTANGVNAYELTNHNDSTTPTGLIVANAPFIAMVVLAIAGLAAYGVSRKRRNERM